ncbi:ATP-binding protein [Rubrivirga sp. S365]|uniref:histidine kinase n=1 Tax=Rubrivirga litoralis TaxID=3075598 RepID=A0ABU3BTD4_9BACT|nr:MULTISPECIES: ATP-binding protein [unclassified Rubrivirga]MDT0632547.1 ATP-binding protein [Rubrivirga sp. F394]MDT7856767.1 ATP-binding protein [Rubrivirga sp. S365]
MTLSRVWRRYRVRLVVRLAVLAAAVGGAAALVVRGGAASAGGAAALAAVAVWAGWGAVRAAERPARDVRRFLEGVRYDDVSGRFSAAGGDPLLDALAAAFEEVGGAFRRVRAEREEQAGYLEAVVRHVGVALVAFRAGGEVTIFNLAARRTLGVARPRSLEVLARRAPEAARALADVAPGERSLVRLGGGEGRPQELVAYATRFTVGGEAHTLVSLQDIREELEARELEAWQELSRVLTHEIANSVAPIASLAGTARSLLDRPAPPEGAAPPVLPGAGRGGRLDDVREALGTIERRSRGLVSFVDAYRTLARLPTPRPRVISAAELLGDVATLARASAPGVTVTVDVDPERLEIVADADLVEQALVNLALNAVEAIGARDGEPSGAAGGAVALRAYAGPGGRAVVEVADDGPGLLPEVAERAFVPFFSTKPGGSGIGLALAQRIARLHGGTLAVSSEPDVETTFTLRL